MSAQSPRFPEGLESAAPPTVRAVPAWVAGLQTRLVVAATFAALVVGWLWPLPRVFDTELLGAPYGWDAKLNAYVIAEGRDNLLHFEAPYEARIFHPHRDVLTWTENLYVFAVAALPLSGLSPIGTHNVLLILGCVLSGLFTWELFRRRGRSAGAALVGALVFSFAPFRLMQLGRIQLSVTLGLPLLFLAFEWASRDPRVRRYVVVGLLWLLQLGMGMYYAVHAALILSAMHVTSLVAGPHRGRRLVAPLPAALVVALGCLAVAPYVATHDAMGFERPTSEVAATSGRFSDLVTASDSMIFWAPLQARLDPLTGREPTYFPGVVPLVLILVGLVGVAWRRREAAATELEVERALLPGHLVALALCLLFFLGTSDDAPVIGEHSAYGWLREVVPGLSGMRYSGRVLLPAWLILAGFAAVAVDLLEGAIRRRLPATKLRQGLVAAVMVGSVGLVLAEPWPAPMPTFEPPTHESLYAGIASDRGAHAVLHLPHLGRAHDAERMDRDLAALACDRPTVNGASGYEPALVDVLVDAVDTFPSGLSHEAMIALGVDRLVLHPPALDLVDTARVPWIEELDRTEEVAVFAVADVPPERADALRRAVAEFEVGPDAPLREIDRSTLRLTGRLRPYQLANLLDGDATTRWTTGRAQQPNELWFTIELPEPRCVQAIWMDYREAPRDLPRGLRITARPTPRDPYETLVDHAVHYPVGALLAAPEQVVDRIPFEPRHVSSLRVATAEDSVARWGSVYELHLEACD